jgi:flagellar hook assembly protein FlgD
MSIDQSKGWHQVIWDGKNEQGNTVSNGVYFARMDLGGTKYLRKMVMLK